ncbi:cyclic nucleotide-binding domain-containing protein [Marinomonas ostreistagni]|uniref:Cyclic nucleotide-binding domain-containing protein n=1 Tax=Marinomonas ostreistagni TaxID=359209 RepID=A0ABS0ZAE2_9GAMM|nr:cyclic nucleotide-binding domain-containing protein [Marinomonas ostreistagni]MBJ7550630.1 cyclic nucleotide-binding domain-containing protein [Marinomonas ostreistagni]
MDLSNYVGELPFTQSAPQHVIQTLNELAQLKELNAGDMLAQQFEVGHSLYFLISGEISISIPLQESGKSYHVGLINQPSAPIGWSAFRQPSRYATSFQATKASLLISWPITKLQKLLEQETDFANQFLSFVYRESLPILTSIQNQTRPFFANESLAFEETRPLINPEIQKQSIKQTTEFLSDTAFCESFTQAELQTLAKQAGVILAHQGDILSQQDQVEDGLYFLVQGKAVVSYQTESGDIITTRTISRPGTVLAWCTTDEQQRNRSTIISSRDSTVLFIPKQSLLSIFAESPKLALKYWYRLIWLVGTHLVSARMRYLSQIAGDEVLAVNSMIEQNAAVLPVSSPLYKVGSLLKNAVTTDEAFGVLYRCLHFGTRIERTVAGMSLDILKDLQRENAFYRKLANIYDSVNALPEEQSSIDVRRFGTEHFRQAFKQVPYIIKGMENLPKKPGSLFFYNHLLGSSSTQLANGFRYSLDAQFISSMVIYKQYGVAAQRVVRRSKEYEFWRDAYYERFGNVFVDSWSALTSGTEAHDEFIRAGQTTLKSKTPLLISPEGKSFATDQSPGELLPYVFELAGSLEGEEEPWLVPIAVANFDKRSDHNIYTVVIKPAFKLSERVDISDKNALTSFLAEYQKEFRLAVKEAEDLAQEIKRYPILSQREGCLSNVRSVNQIDVEFESDVRELEFRSAHRRFDKRPVAFYGSSTIKSWSEFEAPFDTKETINLGFNGATLDACVYYFERIILPYNPRSLVLYAGDNDIGNKHNSNKVIDRYVSLLEKVDRYLPGIPVTILGVKMSPTRQGLEPTVKATNGMLQQLARTRPNTLFVETNDSILDKHGNVDESLFEQDRLHLNQKGYLKLNAQLQSQKSHIFDQ